MKRFYITLLASTVIVSALFYFSIWLSIGSLGAIMIFIAYQFYTERLRALRNQNDTMELQIEALNIHLETAVSREQKTSRDAEQIGQMKQQMAAVLSHEIRTPMNGVMGMTVLLRETSLSKEQDEIVNTIYSCGETLLTTVNNVLAKDVLDFSKLKQPLNILELKNFDLRVSVKEIIELFQQQSGKSGVGIIYHINEDVPVQIIGDNKRLSQVIINLVENAIKFTQKGEVFLGIGCVEQVRAGDSPELVFEIRDSGIGITPDRLKNLFNGMSGKPGRHTSDPANGLGLVICRQIVELMGGHIEVKSEPGLGSTFTFQIPIIPGRKPKQHYLNQRQNMLRDGILDPVTRTRSEYSVGDPIPEDFSGQFPLHILVAEDNIINQKIAMKILAKLGYHPLLANNGKEALEMISQENFDLILMDVQMPEMDGLEATRMIRTCIDIQPVIIAMTANVMLGDRDACMQSGMDDYMSKPIELKELLRQLEKWALVIKDNRKGHA